MNLNRQREILPSILASSPPGRSSTLPPLQRSLNPNRPRKQSVTKRGREAHHKKQKSRGSGGSGGEWLRRLQNDDRLRPGDHNRKALSAEPMPDYGKRWEDLIDAADQAASMAGDVDEERTPVSQVKLRCPTHHNHVANGVELGPAIAGFHPPGLLATLLTSAPPLSSRELSGLASAAGAHSAAVQPRAPRS
jgi:hypothetical protein